MAGYIQVCPGADVNNPADLTAKRIIWVGRNPDSPSQWGAYFKGPVWIGGTNTGNAPFVADASGNLSLNGTLNVTNTATIGPTQIFGTSSSEYASYLTTLYSPRICADGFSVKMGLNTRALGMTEDVDIVTAAGAQYRLHFVKGLYIGRTSLN
jgi:hypothetical protein